MNKLFKGARSSNKKDDLVKQSLTTHLSNSVKQIQYSKLDENIVNPNDVSEATNQLCTTIEAIFLHGLRDSLTHRFKKALADVDERPAPNFWSPLLVISHRQIIDQITNLSQVTTEIGQCRAWVRIALNDCLLSSYIMTIRRDSSALKSFYNNNAYIRDIDLLDVAQHLIEGVETIKTFTIPSNSSLLNTWPLQTLLLAGLWAPTLKAMPVAAGHDVALNIEENERARDLVEEASDTASVCSIVSFGSIESVNVKPNVSEEDALKIILGENSKVETNKNEHSSDEIPSVSSSDIDIKSDEGPKQNIGNSLNTRSGWSFDQHMENNGNEITNNKVCEAKTPEASEPKSMETSYTDVLASYSNQLSTTPDIREVWQKWQEQRTDEDNGSLPNDENTAGISQLTNSTLLRTESTSLSTQVVKIAREKGLNLQDFQCAGCKHDLGIPGKPNVCAFTGEYFCNSCMSPEPMSIPARIIHNWDFKQYPVSQKSYNYVNEIKGHPVIDFKVVNPYIYGAVQEMAELQSLRNQLNYLRAYMYTCREPIIAELQKMMWPREYMYEHIHQYSISDLQEIQNDNLAKQLEKVVQFGRDHVASCWLCSQKGFVCEVCEKSKPLFPFDVENVYRCEICYAVYHKNCLNASKPCRKCDRLRKREELPLLATIVTE